MEMNFNDFSDFLVRKRMEVVGRCRREGGKEEVDHGGGGSGQVLLLPSV